MSSTSTELSANVVPQEQVLQVELAESFVADPRDLVVVQVQIVHPKIGEDPDPYLFYGVARQIQDLQIW
jgi:hypothetical protein